MASLALTLRNHRHYKTSKTLLKPLSPNSNLTFSLLFSSSSDNNENENSSNTLNSSDDFKSKLKNQLEQHHQNPINSTLFSFDAIHETLRRLSAKEAQKRGEKKGNDKLSWNKESSRLSSLMAESRVKRREKMANGDGGGGGGVNNVAKIELVEPEIVDDVKINETTSKEQMVYPVVCQPGSRRRRWTVEENFALREVLKDLVSSGNFKGEDAINNDFLDLVEEKLKVKLPTSGLKADPHIRSRIRYFKHAFEIISGMVVQHSNSGFRWDSGLKKVIADDEVWEEYLKDHPEAREYRDRFCPYYDDLCIIFGKAQSSSIDSKAPQTLRDELKLNEMSKQEVVESLSTHGPPERTEMSIDASTIKGERAGVGDDLVKGLSIVASILGKDIRAASSEISRAVGFHVMLSEKRSRINGELSKLGLSKMDRHRATRKIAREPETVDIFFSIPDVEKQEWVEALLHGVI